MKSDDVITGGILTLIAQDGSTRPLKVDDIEIKIQYQIRDEVKKDCSCGSEYMIPALDRVGDAIQVVFHCVLPALPCYLVMDNMGGHGTDEVIELYKKYLQENTILLSYSKYYAHIILKFLILECSDHCRQGSRRNIT